MIYTCIFEFRPVTRMNSAVKQLDRSTPWLSVVIPSHRGERWIDAALQSILEGTAEGVEVLVVDGSPDAKTRDIALGYSDRLDIKVFERADLTSWHTKTNFGVTAALATHVCWLGVDDVWLPGRAAAARSWINCSPDAALHLAPSVIIDTTGRRRGLWKCPFSSSGEIPSRTVMRRLLVQNFIAAPAPVFRRDAWLTAGGLDTRLWYTADWDIWLKLAASGPVRFHDRPTIGFRVHGGSLTTVGSRDSSDFSRQMEMVLERHLTKVDADDGRTERIARASILVNSALAAAATGDLSRLPRAAAQVLRLGPRGIQRYFRDSRIVDRLVPRIMARLSGGY